MLNRLTARFVRPVILTAALAAGTLLGHGQKQTQKHKKESRSYYAASGYVMGAQVPQNFVPALGRMVFARGQAFESAAFQKSFFIGDAKNPLHGDSLNAFFQRWGSVDTYCRNMILDVRGAKKTVRVGTHDIDDGLVFRNSADSVAPSVIHDTDLFSALGRVAHTVSDPRHGYVNIVLTADGGLASFPRMVAFPARTRLVTYATKQPAPSTQNTMHPGEYIMQVMNPRIHGARADSYYMAEIATVAAPIHRDVFVTFVSDKRGQADTVRIGDKIVYGDTHPDTPTLYVANIDAVAAQFLENKDAFPNKTNMPPRTNMTIIEAQLRKARKHGVAYDDLGPDLIRDLRALAVEVLSNRYGKGPDAPYGYEIFGAPGSDAFRAHVMRPSTNNTDRNFTP